MTASSRRIFAVSIIVLLTAAFVAAWSSDMFGWNPYKGNAQGLRLEGDPAAPPTRRWNHWWLAWKGWKTVTVLEVSEKVAKDGYRIGYRPESGDAMLHEEVRHDRRFRMKNGYEACAFFVLMTDSKEAPLTVVARTTVSDPAYRDAPLH